MQTETFEDTTKHNDENDDTIVLTSDTLNDNVSTDDNVVELHAAEPNLEQQLANMKDQWLRAVAEGENIRKRAQRDKDDALKYGAINLARDIVSIADNLQRALQVCEKEDRSTFSSNIQSLVVGIEMINKEIESAFERHRIKRIYPVLEKFDPNIHQAIFEIETTEHPVGTVMNVMQAGYMLHDRLLRPAMVGVSKAITTPAVDAPPSHENTPHQSSAASSNEVNEVA